MSTYAVKLEEDKAALAKKFPQLSGVSKILHLAIRHGIMMMAHSPDRPGSNVSFLNALSSLTHFLYGEPRDVLGKVIDYINVNPGEEIELHDIAIRQYFYPQE